MQLQYFKKYNNLSVTVRLSHIKFNYYISTSLIFILEKKIVIYNSSLLYLEAVGLGFRSIIARSRLIYDLFPSVGYIKKTEI